MIIKKKEQINDVLTICCLQSQITKISVDLNQSQQQNQKINMSKAPLHSHQGIINQSFSQFSLNNSFRILNLSDKLPEKALKHMEKINTKNIYAFGSSQIRQVKMFHGKQNQENKNVINQLCFETICGTAIQHHNQNETLIVQPKISPTKVQEIKNDKHKNFGFGVSQKLNRTNVYKNFNNSPGPGSYNINQSFSGNGQKINQQNYRITQRMQGSKQIDDRVIYNIKSSFQQQVNKIVSRQRLKMKIIENKKKNSVLLQMLNLQNKRKTLPSMEQQNNKKDLEGKQKASHQQTQKRDQINKAKNQTFKLFRNQLRDKTSLFLPKNNSYKFTVQSDQHREPIYKLANSNSFKIKNDHAYQAHYYRPQEHQSEYVFIRGKLHQKINSQKENSSFLSNVKRSIF